MAEVGVEAGVGVKVGVGIKVGVGVKVYNMGLGLIFLINV